MSKRYKAQRSFYWQPPEGGDEQLARPGDVIDAERLSVQTITDLLADGSIKETRAKAED